MPSITSRGPTRLFLLALGLTLSGCATQSAVTIPESLRAPCVSTVDVSGAQTVGDLAKAIIQGDGDLRVCSIQKEAITAIAEAKPRRWWMF